MKTSHPAAPAAAPTPAYGRVLPVRIALLPALAATMLMFTSRSSAQATTPAIPVGWMTASPEVVQTGTKPVLAWGITYPSIVKDYVDIDEPATIKPKEKLKMEVRVLGAGVTVANNNGSNLSFVRTQGYFSYNSTTSNISNFTKIFDGTNNNVNPNTVVHTQTVDANKTIRFGGRYYYNSSWSSFYYSNMGKNNVRSLVSGDTPPTAYPMASAPTLEDFMRPYLDASGKVKIGPMDVIVVMELTHTDSQSTQLGYDLQDLVLLVTFKPI